MSNVYLIKNNKVQIICKYTNFKITDLSDFLVPQSKY